MLIYLIIIIIIIKSIYTYKRINKLLLLVSLIPHDLRIHLFVRIHQIIMPRSIVQNNLLLPLISIRFKIKVPSQLLVQRNTHPQPIRQSSNRELVHLALVSIFQYLLFHLVYLIEISKLLDVLELVNGIVFDSDNQEHIETIRRLIEHLFKQTDNLLFPL